jgi:plasmid stabilization system protein ParE
MDYQVIWTDEAIADLRAVVGHIAGENPEAAVRLGEAVIRRSLLLASHPRLGRVYRKLRSDFIREFPTPPYRLIYEIRDKEAVVLIRTLWHGARQEPDIR